MEQWDMTSWSHDPLDRFVPSPYRNPTAFPGACNLLGNHLHLSNTHIHGIQGLWVRIFTGLGKDIPMDTVFYLHCTEQIYITMQL